MGNKIEVLSIKCSGWPFSVPFYWEKNDKKVNIFYAENGAGKSLLFTTLNYMIAGENKKDYIAYDMQSFSANLELLINNKRVSYKKDNFILDISMDGSPISLLDYKIFLKEELDLDQNLTAYSRGKKVRKNTILSTLRYNFISDNDLYRKAKWYQNKIPLVNTHYDYNSKMPLLGYFLWIDFTIKQFEDFCELCKMKKFLIEKKCLYEKILNYQNIFDTEKEKELYSKYMSIKTSVVDLNYAIHNIVNILTLAQAQESEIVWIDEDILFLNEQKKMLSETLENLKKEKREIKKQIDGLTDIWREFLLRSEEAWANNKKRLLKEYEEYKDKEPVLEDKLKWLLTEYHIIFTKLYQFLFAQFNKYGIYSGNYPSLDIDTQELILEKPVSEGQIIWVRIIWIILLLLFSYTNKGRIPNILFLDSISEKISEYWSGNTIYAAINELVSEYQEFPQTFLFVSWNFDNVKYLSNFQNFSILELNKDFKWTNPL